MDQKLKTRTDYDRSAFMYETRYKSIQWSKYRIMIETVPKGRILDLGCGTGLLADFLQKKIYGIDISFQMLKKASLKEIVVQADMDFLPFNNAVFDAVLSFTSLQNLPSTDHVFKEVRRVLKKGCPFIGTLLKGFSIESAEQYFTLQTIRHCGEDVGFICW